MFDIYSKTEVDKNMQVLICLTKRNLNSIYNSMAYTIIIHTGVHIKSLRTVLNGICCYNCYAEKILRLLVDGSQTNLKIHQHY